MTDYIQAQGSAEARRQNLIEQLGRGECPESVRQAIEDMLAEIAVQKRKIDRLESELNAGDSWAWIRGKFEKSKDKFRWYTPRTDGLVSTRYEVMGWLHCLFADADPTVFIDIALEHQKKADDAEQEIAALKAKVLDNIQRHEDIEAQIRRDAGEQVRVLREAMLKIEQGTIDHAAVKWARTALASTAPVAEAVKPPCEYCGPVCYGDTAHSDRVANNFKLAPKPHGGSK